MIASRLLHLGAAARTWFRAVGFVLCWLLAAGAVQAATYAFRSDSFAWESASTQITWDRACTQYPGDDDQATITFTGGFTFTFAGTTYSSVRVLANGMLQFGTDTGLFRDFTNDPMPIGTAPTRSGCVAGPATNVLAAYWTDLDPSRSGSGRVYWQQKGTSPNRYVVVSWEGVYQYNTSTPYTFQIILFENGEFKYQYGNANATGSNATIGVQVDSSDYTQYSYNSGYNANGTAIRWFRASGVPNRMAEYRMDEFSWNGTVGEVLDSSGNGNHGVRVGSSAQTTANGYVCRAFEVPSNTNTTITAVDTALDVDASLGNSGSLSFWWRANTQWNTSNNAAMLMDATTVANRPFFLQRNAGGALRFTVSDTNGTTLTATSAVQNIAANTWVHIAATWRLASGSNQTVLRIYVNGLQVAVALGTTTGSLPASLGTLFVGDNRSANTPTGATTNSANGRIDELSVYNYEVSQIEIAADMAVTHACTAALHHIEIQGSAEGLTCTPSTLTVVACLDASCTARSTTGVTGTITASPSTNVIWPDGNSFTIPAGSSSVQLRVQRTSAGSFVLGTSGLTPAATNATTCNFGSPQCTHTVSDAGLLFDVPNHVADATQSGINVAAVRASDNAQACVPAFQSTTKTLTFRCSYTNPTSGTRAVRINGTALNASNNAGAACDGSGRSFSLSFNASGVATISAAYADVGQVQLTASYSGSGSDAGVSFSGNDSFITRPAGLAFSGWPARAKAGEPFSGSVRAINASGDTTPNFGQESPRQTPVASLAGAPANGAITTGGLATFSSGSATWSGMAWTEVGTLTATLGLSSYLGTTMSPASWTQSVPVGPYSLRVRLYNRNSSACPTTAYAYGGEPFRAVVTALNMAGATTQNYAGAHARNISFEVLGGAAGDNASAGAGLTAAAFTLGAATAVDPSYTFTNKLSAPRTISLRAREAGTDPVSSSAATEEGLAVRSGRLRLSNAFGSEKSALNVPLVAEYWTGQAWVKNGDDHCTTLPASAVAVSNVRSHTGASGGWTTSASLATTTAAGGNFTLMLSAPNASGTVDLALNLGSGANPQACLGNNPAATGAGLPWLRSRHGAGPNAACASAPWDRDPAARAAFGIYTPESKSTVHVRDLF